jgi:UDP-glucose 4-epimerase
VRFAYRGGDRGWKGDIPVVRLNTDRIRALGWANRMPTGEALRSSILAMIPDAKEGRL